MRHYNMLVKLAQMIDEGSKKGMLIQQGGCMQVSCFGTEFSTTLILVKKVGYHME